VSARERLRTQFMRAVEIVGRELEAASEHEQAIAHYLRAVDADPLAEGLYQGLMRCYLSLSRRAEAGSVYRRLQRTLAVALGVEPSSGTQALFREALKG
jgi:DNA-binding SARP family transcriptional activator